MNLRPVLALLLLLTPFAASAAPHAADLQPSTDDVAGNWHEAVVASGLDLEHPIELVALSTENGVTEYRMQSLETGEIAFARVRLPVDPALSAPSDDTSEALAERNCAPESSACNAPLTTLTLADSSRCKVTIYSGSSFTGSSVQINIDLNTFNSLNYFAGGGLNDTVSSLKTTCNAAYFYEHKNWLGSSLYVPANTSLASLGSLDNRISSLWHVIP